MPINPQQYEQELNNTRPLPLITYEMTKRSREKAEAAQNGPNPDDHYESLILAKKNAVDPSLELLFASSAGPVKAPPKARYDEDRLKSKKIKSIDFEKEFISEEQDSHEDDEILSDVEEGLEEENVLEPLDGRDSSGEPSIITDGPINALEIFADKQQVRKRKHTTDDDDLEGKYMLRLAKEEEKEEQERQAERRLKRQRLVAEQDPDMPEEEKDLDKSSVGNEKSEEAFAEVDPLPLDVPRHETLGPNSADDEVEKASRTVFLANVSTAAITDKKVKKTLLQHMESFLSSLPEAPDGKTKHVVESIRFRSTAYAGGGIPKKAAFATKSLMDATTKSTNAYVVYSTAFAAREAVKRLNATVVLDRHLRVDGVAHPAKTDHRRCVFVGNLGFVDDESMIDQGGDGERKRSRIPSDIEEGLWRQFGKAGKVESVRVVRDEKTRVGKGFAYVQFEDANSVEAALLFHDKKYPPMLPRILRVTRAKAMKKTDRAEKASKGLSRPFAKASGNPNHERIYNPKMSSQQQSLQGRAGKLLGKAGAAQFRKADGAKSSNEQGSKAVPGVARPPESFVFEGYRASANSGKPKDLKFGNRGGKKKGKPKTRSSKRGGDWKKQGGKKAT